MQELIRERLSLSLIRISMIILSLILLPSFQLVAKPRPVTWEDLKELKNGKVPKNAKKKLTDGMTYLITVYTPRAQAAHFADAAKENYIKLDSSLFNPDMFNSYVQLHVVNIFRTKPEDIRQINRGVILKNDKVYEMDSVVYIESTLQNAYGAKYVNIDAFFYVPIELFDGWDDIKIVIFNNIEKVEAKLKKKDIKKLE